MNRLILRAFINPASSSSSVMASIPTSSFPSIITASYPRLLISLPLILLHCGPHLSAASASSLFPNRPAAESRLRPRPRSRAQKALLHHSLAHLFFLAALFFFRLCWHSRSTTPIGMSILDKLALGAEGLTALMGYIVADWDQAIGAELKDLRRERYEYKGA